MKILYHHRIASKDGQYVHVEELSNAFIEQGHELIFVAPSINQKTKFGHDGGIVTKLKKLLPQALYEMLELSYSIWIFIKLAVAIKTFKPDFIYERYNLYQPAGIWASKLFNIPIMLEVNAPLVYERRKYSGLALTWLATKIERYTWQNATHTLPVSRVLADYLIKAGVKEKNITVIHNGVNKHFLESLTPITSHEDKEEIIIGFVGFIHRWHGLDKAIEAIAKHKKKSLKLICIGDGDILPELKQQAENLGIKEKVIFTGLLNRKQTLEQIKQFDIALQPNVTHYASPLKLFEYMAVGCLIIAPDCDNIKEILTDESALLFNKNVKSDFVVKLNCAVEKFNTLINKRFEGRESLNRNSFIWQENTKNIVNIIENKPRDIE
ncbi:glycosyltransferase [Thalassotalea nanhaiensis]|uniref:Glycosyltransferase n=1 Tax=Thalassotalea nanhaiensis TaxID=3065648 RepID=A0ABY9TI85_9GAMM|nr:glycosyltransferase [Colwelliaceae bacterium SQ345]